MRSIQWFGSLFFAIGVLTAGQARAQDPAGGPTAPGKAADEAAEARENAAKRREGAEMRKEKAQEMRDRRQAQDGKPVMDQPGKSMRPKPRRHRDPKVDKLDRRSEELRRRAAQVGFGKDKKAAEELRKERLELREELRQARRQHMNKRWGKLLAKEPALAEAKLHARRMARLNRARALAEEHQKEALLARIDELLAKEQARHEAKMTELRKAEPAAMPAAAADGESPVKADDAEPAQAAPERASEEPTDDEGAE